MDYIKSMTESVSRMEKDLFAAMDKMQVKQRELDDELLQLKQKGIAMPLETKGGPTLGSKVWAEVEKNRDLITKNKGARLEIKAAGDALTTSVARNLVSVGVGSPIGGVLGVQNALRITPADGTSAVEYSRYTGQEGAAGVQAGEGVAKAAVRPTFSLISQAALTVAGYTKISRQAMNDSAELTKAIDTTLMRSIGTALDSALMSGNVTPAFDGLLALATAYTSLVYEAIPDAASEAVATMQEAGFVPDTIVLKPSDWLGVQVALNAVSGDYLAGPYLAPLPELMRGMKVVLSPGMTAGKVMVMDSSQIDLLVVDGFAVEVGYENDDFTKNIATLLGEMRVIPTFRATGAARLITPKAGV